MNSISVYADAEFHSQPYRFTIDFIVPRDVLDGIERYFENGQKLPDNLISYIDNEFDVKPENKNVYEKLIQEKYSLVPNNISLPMKRGGKPFIFLTDERVEYLFLVPYDSDNLADFYAEVSDRKRRPPSEDDEPTQKRQRTAAARLLQRHNGDIEAAAQMLAKIQF